MQAKDVELTAKFHQGRTLGHGDQGPRKKKKKRKKNRNELVSSTSRYAECPIRFEPYQLQACRNKTNICSRFAGWLHNPRCIDYYGDSRFQRYEGSKSAPQPKAEVSMRARPLHLPPRNALASVKCQHCSSFTTISFLKSEVPKVVDRSISHSTELFYQKPSKSDATASATKCTKLAAARKRKLKVVAKSVSTADSSNPDLTSRRHDVADAHLTEQSQDRIGAECGSGKLSVGDTKLGNTELRVSPLTDPVSSELQKNQNSLWNSPVESTDLIFHVHTSATTIDGLVHPSKRQCTVVATRMDSIQAEAKVQGTVIKDGEAEVGKNAPSQYSIFVFGLQKEVSTNTTFSLLHPLSNSTASAQSRFELPSSSCFNPENSYPIYSNVSSDFVLDCSQLSTSKSIGQESACIEPQIIDQFWSRLRSPTLERHVDLQSIPTSIRPVNTAEKREKQWPSICSLSWNVTKWLEALSTIKSYVLMLTRMRLSSFSPFRPSIDPQVYRRKVVVNDVAILDARVRIAELEAGPIHPGNYWYDVRAGFWGVAGGPCLGIIPPFIDEFDYPMARNCSGGSTGITVNGRELHRLDLEKLMTRGFPDVPGMAYCVEIDGRILELTSGEELEGLGHLAPSLEISSRGSGMYSGPITE